MLLQKLNDKYSLRVKMIFTCFLFLVPVVYLLAKTFSVYDKDINFAKQEMRGTKLLRPAFSLLAAIEERNRLKTKPDDADELTRIEEKVETIFGVMKDLEKEHGHALQLASEDLLRKKRERSSVSALRESWLRLKGSEDKTSDSSLTLMSDVRTLMTHVADASNLTLDPDLDSYYVMDAVVVALPQLLTRLVAISGSSVAQDGKATALAALLEESDLGRAVGDLETAIAEDLAFYGSNNQLQSTVNSSLETLQARTNPLVGYLRSGNASQQGKPIETSLAAAGTVELWQLSVDVLDALLQARIQKIEGDRGLVMLASGFLVLGMMALTWLATRTLVLPVEKMAKNVVMQARSLTDVTQAMDTALENSFRISSNQGSSMEKVVSSMEEMSSMVSLTSQSTQKTSADCKASHESAQNGLQVVDEMVQAMNQIAAANERLESLMSIIDEIKSRTKVINDIAFETKLLAFNASIEAARAGAHGRGFAVVADEVGKLAQVSNRAADEVRSLLEQSSQDVASIVNETKGKILEGQKRSATCSQVFRGMQDSTSSISQGMQNIARATQEQATGIKLTNAAMLEMEKDSQNLGHEFQNTESQLKRLRYTVSSLHREADAIRDIILGGKSIESAPYKQQDAARDQTVSLVERNAVALDPQVAAPTSESRADRDDSRWNAA